jgi:predicted dinucleotide-binding enzyme
MKITVVGRGNVGGGLARMWRDAGAGLGPFFYRVARPGEL